MENKSFQVSLKKNPAISIKAIPGHFTTSDAHFNYYLDVSGLKFDASVAWDAAQELAIPYLTSTMVDTIVCMERTEIIGAYLADVLLNDGMSAINTGGSIHIVTPGHNTSGKFVFQDSVVEWISGRNIILLVTSISSGRTVNSALECISYYGGSIVGVSGLFMALPNNLEPKPHTLFTSDDIPEYKVFNINECEMCKKGRRLDALVSSEGYTRL